MNKAIVSKHDSVDVQAWAGLGSDISYYLNSHHIDLHVWAMQARNTFITLIILVISVITITKNLNASKKILGQSSLHFSACRGK